MALITPHLDQLCLSRLQREAVPAHQRTGLSRSREETRTLRGFQRPHGGQALVLAPIPGIRGAAHGAEEGIHRLQFPETTRKMAVPVMFFNYSLTRISMDPFALDIRPRCRAIESREMSRSSFRLHLKRLRSSPRLIGRDIWLIYHV